MTISGLGPHIAALKQYESRVRDAQAASASTWTDSQSKKYEEQFITPLLAELRRAIREFESIDDELTRARMTLSRG